MDYLLHTLVISLVLPLLIYLSISLTRRRQTLPSPPGNRGLPFIGETLAFLSHQSNNDLPSFSALRIQKYGSVFSTRIFGDMSVMSNTSSFHRLLFTSENTLVHASWPSSVYAVLGEGSLLAKVGTEAQRLRSAIMTFLVPSALQRYVERVDAIAVKHLEEHWDGKDLVGVYSLLKRFTFAVACELFVSVTDKSQEEELLEPFNAVMGGLFRVPITLPWTRYSKAKKAGRLLRQRFRVWIAKRRREEEEGSNDKDLLSCLLHYRDEDGKPLGDEEIPDNILTLLMAGHDTTRSMLTIVMKNLAVYNWCYNEVLKEQISIRAGKKAGGAALNWGDLQQMQYSWWVMQETLRLEPVVFGAWRNAIRDIEYEEYIVPKGWKLFWSSNTHHDSQYFPSPDKFDPSRFSCAPTPYTFVPFGGGPRMCPGNEFAKMVSLVFLHHVVTRYEWTLLRPHERFIIDPMPVPSHGLHIKLSPHGANK